MLRTSGRLILVLSFGLGIGIAVYVYSQFASFNSILNGVEQATDCIGAFAAISEYSSKMSLCMGGLLPCTPTDATAWSGALLAAAGVLTSKLQSAYTTAQGVALQGPYDTPSVPMVAAVLNATTGAVDTHVEWTSLLEASLALVAQAQQYALRPTAPASAASLVFLDANARRGCALHDYANATLFTWLSGVAAMDTNLLTASAAVFGSMAGVVAVLALLVVLPILVYVDRARDKYLIPFVQLPAVVPSRLRTRAERHLRLLQAADASDEDEEGGMEDDGVEGGSGEEGLATDDDGGLTSPGSVADWGALLRGTGSGGSGGGGGGSGIGNATPGAHTPVARGPRRSTSGGGTVVLQTRGYKKSARSLGKLAARFMTPLVLVLTFFVAIYAVTVKEASTLQGLEVFNMASNLQDLDAMEVHNAVRDALATAGNASSAAVVRATTAAAAMADSLEYHHRLLLFVGQPAAPELAAVSAATVLDGSGLDAGIITNIRNLLYSDACTVLAMETPGFNATACAAFRDGVLLHGMHSAMSDYLTLVRTLIARRAAADVPAVGAAGVLHLSDGSTVPYSQASEFASDIYVTTQTYGTVYLQRLTAYMADPYAAVSDEHVSTVNTFLIAFVTLFLLFLAAYLFLVFTPQVVATNAEILNERVVLLLLPAAVLRSIPQLEELVARVVDEAVGMDDKA